MDEPHQIRLPALPPARAWGMGERIPQEWDGEFYLFICTGIAPLGVTQTGSSWLQPTAQGSVLLLLLETKWEKSPFFRVLLSSKVP